MKDVHELYTRFKEEFPEIGKRCEELGRAVHEDAGPIGEKDRWLIKMGIAGASGHLKALETHIRKAEAAGASQEEVRQVILMLISTVGFPAFMEAYTVYKRIYD